MRKYTPWLGAIVLLIILFGTLYAVVLQAQREAANDPQIQLAEDMASKLNNGGKPDVLMSRVAIRTSLAPFVIIYDASGKVVSGSGYLDGKLPSAPYGVLASAAHRDYSWVTWQPADDVRIAAVTVKANKYFVLSGRSLREVEKRENQSLQMSFAGGLASLIVLGLVYVIKRRYAQRPTTAV